MFSLTKQTIGCIVWVDEKLLNTVYFSRIGVYAQYQREYNRFMTIIADKICKVTDNET